MIPVHGGCLASLGCSVQGAGCSYVLGTLGDVSPTTSLLHLPIFSFTIISGLAADMSWGRADTWTDPSQGLAQILAHRRCPETL